MVMLIENDLSIQLPDEAMTNLHTVADAVAYVKAGVPQHVGFALDADSDAEQPEREGGGGATKHD